MNTYDIIGFPINLGCDKVGNELTPAILRRENCYTSSDNIVNDLGDIPSISCAAISRDKYSYHKRIKYLDPILDASEDLCHSVRQSLRQGHIPVCIGGDHVLAFGSIAAIALEKGADNYAVVYVDAHGDFNTELTSASGNMHGMHMSYLMGLGQKELAHYWGKFPILRTHNIYYLGARALDPGEVQVAQEHNIFIRSSYDLNFSTPSNIVDSIVSDIINKGIDHIHISFDIDVIDPIFAPGTGVPEKDGISPKIGYEIVKQLMNTGLVKSADIVELNNLLDPTGKTKEIFKNTLRLILS